MHKFASALAPLLLIASAARADGPPTQAPKNLVSYPSGAEKIEGFLAAPKGPGKHGALIVIHDWLGLNDFAKNKARKFEGAGYVALAIDLYRGKVANDPDTAHQLMRGLPDDRAARDLDAAFKYLAGRPDVDPARIGVVGWCMGGGHALNLALAEPRLAAAAIYYGHLATDGDKIGKIKAALLGNFGADDQGIPAADVNKFAEDARKRGVRADFKVYPGCGHAFASSSDPKTFKGDAAKDADARTDAFFKQHLAAK